MCGENANSVEYSMVPEGSSPRVRGKLLGSPPTFTGERLIPACAGKTATATRCGRKRWAHPRVCGENAKNILCGIPEAGSSPRVRGKPIDDKPIGLHRGLIPACAGKTS